MVVTLLQLLFCPQREVRLTSPNSMTANKRKKLSRRSSSETAVDINPGATHYSNSSSNVVSNIEQIELRNKRGEAGKTNLLSRAEIRQLTRSRPNDGVNHNLPKNHSLAECEPDDQHFGNEHNAPHTDFECLTREARQRGPNARHQQPNVPAKSKDLLGSAVANKQIKQTQKSFNVHQIFNLLCGTGQLATCGCQTLCTIAQTCRHFNRCT